MIRGFYSAVSGILSQQSRMDTIANNLSNVSTPGYKLQRSTFSTLLYDRINGGAGPVSMGHGAKNNGTSIDMEQGDLIHTGMSYDFAIVGDGFFALGSDKKEDRVYKRDGSFQLSQAGGKTYLSDGSGRFLLGKNNQRLEVTETFCATDIGIYRFSNPYALKPGGKNSYEATPSSGKAEELKDPVIKQGYLEASSVNAAEEMVQMIESSKAFSLNAKVVQTADEMEKVINQLR